EVVVAGGGEQHGLDLGAERAHRPRQQDMAHDLGAGGAARLARHLDADAEGAKPRRQQRRMGGLAGSLPAPEGDEASAHSVRLAACLAAYLAACFAARHEAAPRSAASARAAAPTYSCSAALRNSLIASSATASRARCGSDPTATLSAVSSGTS